MVLFPKVAVSLLVAVPIYLTGCGGGSSPLPPPPPPPPSGTTINVTFPGMPTAIASQIGTANWVTASVPSNQKWSFTIPEGTSRYAIAYVCPDYSDPHFTVYNEYVFEATTLDTTTYTVPCFVPPPGDVSASGSIDASAFPSTASVVIYSNESGLGVPLTGQFTMDHSPGTSDLAALAGDASSNILAVKILRSQTFPGTINGGEPITFQASDATTLHPIVVTNAPWGNLEPTVKYVTANGTSFFVDYRLSGSYSVVPSSEAQSRDYYSFQANEQNVVIVTPPNEWIASVQTATSPVATLGLPVPMAYSAPAPAAFPVFTINYSGFAGMNASAYAAEIYWNSSVVTVVATSGFLNGANTLPIPDLTSLPGFLTPADSGTSVNWITIVAGGTSIAWYSPDMQPSPRPWFTALPPANESISWVENDGTYVEP